MVLGNVPTVFLSRPAVSGHHVYWSGIHGKLTKSMFLLDLPSTVGKLQVQAPVPGNGRLATSWASMNMNNHKLKVFSGRANISLAEKIARHLGDSLGKMTLDNFPDGEVSVRIEEDVRGRD